MSESSTTTTTTTTNNNNNNNNNSNGDLTLFQAFRIAQRIYIELEDSKLSANDPEYQKQVKEAISNLLKANMYINSQNVFSKNEELDDIRTDLLKYLLVSYYLSELFLKIIDGNRIKNLKMSKLKVLDFLHRCEKLELVDKEDIVIIQREGKSNPMDRRNELVSRGKRDKEIKEKLKYIVKKREQLLKDKNGNELDDEMEDCGDEELERDFIGSLLKDAISKGIALMETIDVELPMLIEIDAIKDKHGGILPPQPPPKSSNIGNFQILPDGRRVQLDRVFRPSHILPTLTPEQAAEIEMRNGNFIQGGGPQSSKENQESDDEDEEEDNEKLKQDRRWADYKDENPRGWGNVK